METRDRKRARTLASPQPAPAAVPVPVPVPVALQGAAQVPQDMPVLPASDTIPFPSEGDLLKDLFPEAMVIAEEPM